MDSINSLSIDISVELGATKMPVHQLLRMGRGAVIELETMENDDLVLLANNTPIANGQVMLREDKILISVTKLLPRPPEVRANNVLRTFGGEPKSAEDIVANLTASEAIEDTETGIELDEDLVENTDENTGDEAGMQLPEFTMYETPENV